MKIRKLLTVAAVSGLAVLGAASAAGAHNEPTAPCSLPSPTGALVKADCHDLSADLAAADPLAAAAPPAGAVPGAPTPPRSAAKAVTRASLSGDARAELVSMNADTKLWGKLNVNGLRAAWGPNQQVGSGWTEPARTRFADMNADGKSEIISITPDGKVWAFLNIKGMSGTWAAKQLVGTGWKDAARTHFADLDGDGKAELISVNATGKIMAFGNVDGMRGKWSAGKVIYTTTQGAQADRTRFADFDSDGKADLITIKPDGNITVTHNLNAMKGQWKAHGNTAGGWKDTVRTRLADLDGDGRAELVSLNADGRIVAYRNVDGMKGKWGPAQTVATGWLDHARTLFA